MVEHLWIEVTDLSCFDSLHFFLKSFLTGFGIKLFELKPEGLEQSIFFIFLTIEASTVDINISVISSGDLLE